MVMPQTIPLPTLTLVSTLYEESTPWDERPKHGLKKLEVRGLPFMRKLPKSVKACKLKSCMSEDQFRLPTPTEGTIVRTDPLWVGC